MSGNLTTIKGNGLLSYDDQEGIPIQYAIRQRQKYVETNEAGLLPGAVEFIGAELVLRSGTLPTDTIMTLQLQDGTQKRIIINRLVRVTPPTYDFAIAD